MFFTIGVHPHHANEINAEYLEKLKEAIHVNNPNAIGESGLDFFRNLSSFEELIFAFEELINIAIDTNITIHFQIKQPMLIYIITQVVA